MAVCKEDYGYRPTDSNSSVFISCFSIVLLPYYRREVYNRFEYTFNNRRSFIGDLPYYRLYL